MTIPIIIPKVFTKKQCEIIISFHSNWTEDIGKASGQVNPLIRQCIIYTPPTEAHIPIWFGQKIIKTYISANEKTFNFDLGKGEFELYLVRYDSGGHYRAHFDIHPTSTPKRKLSFTLLLNDSYEGGILKFIGLTKAPESNPVTGDMIIFPSYLTHKVEPVTSGVRWVLVGFILGDKHFI
jgi:predicted 2-oxoglutarate/Fe(II)-dependent dioxygenase YbiX